MKLVPLCSLLWRILTWCSRKQVTNKARHIPSWLNVIANKLSRLGQIQTEWLLPPEVFQSICSKWHQPQVDLFTTRFNNKLPQFVFSTPPPTPTPPSMGSECTLSTMAGSYPFAFPSVAILRKVVQKSGREVAGLQMQEYHPDCSRVAQHALVLGPRGHVGPNPILPTQVAQSVNSAIQSDPSQKSVKPKTSCLSWTLQTKRGICPLMSSKMRISLDIWIASTDTDPIIGGHSLLKPFPGAAPIHKSSL